MSKDDELQKAILNNIPDQAWLKDRDSRYILVNDAFIAACRLPESEILHKTPDEVWPEEWGNVYICLLYTSPSPRDQRGSRMPSSA